jgi:hypothetical protein
MKGLRFGCGVLALATLLGVPSLGSEQLTGVENGQLNIYHPPTADPTTGIMYTPHARDCSAPSYLVPTEGKDQERTEFAGKSSEEWRGRDRVTPTTGTTVAPWKQGGPTTGRLPLIDGLPVFKPFTRGSLPTT